MTLNAGRISGDSAWYVRLQAMCTAVGLGLWALPLSAAQFSYEVGYRAEYSDNVTHLENERDRVTINMVNGRILFQENTSDLVARILAGATYYRYSPQHFDMGDHIQYFDAQSNLLLDAYGEAFFLDRHTSWVVADGFRKVLVNPLAPDTPENRQNSNVWATGPNVFLRLTPVDMVTAEGRIGRSWIAGEEFDNRRWSYALRWAHRHSERGTSSLNAEKLEVKFDEIIRDDITNEVVNRDLNRYNYFYRFDLRDSRTQFNVDLGRTRIERFNADAFSDWLARLSLTTAASRISSMGFHYRREFADTGGELLPSAPVQPMTGITGSGAPILGSDVVSDEPYYLKQVNAFYSHRNPLLPWQISTFYRDISYQTLPNDRLERGVALGVNYHYSSRITFQASGAYSMQEYNLFVERVPAPAPPQSLTRLLNRKDRDSNVGVGILYRLTPNLHAVLDFRRYTRNSSTDLNPDANPDPDQISESDNGSYTDDRIGLSLRYSSAPAAR